MLLVTFMVHFVVLAARVVANPTVIHDSGSRISLPISRHISRNGKLDLIQRDRKHSKSSVKDGQRQTPNLTVNDTGVVYVTNVGVGNPATSYNLILDTASANIWVGANQPYKMTSSSVKTGDSVSVHYTSSADFTGSEYRDTVTFAPGLAISQQSIGVADSGNLGGFHPFDGILGIGPQTLSVGTLDPDESSAIPTVTDNLFQQGKICQNIVALYFEPMNSGSVGEMTFGDTDSSKYTGSITYFPITKTNPAAKYWGVDASFRYGDASVILKTTAGVIDTITKLILITTDAYNNYVSATGAVLDKGTGLLSITSEQYGNLQSLFFDIGGSTYEITPNAQIAPRALNKFIGGTSDGIYLVVQDISLSRLAGMDFILGRPFLERFYTVFDSGKSSIGFAMTQFTKADTN